MLRCFAVGSGIPRLHARRGRCHTFASILFAIGEDPRYVMGQLGHADAGFTLLADAKEMDRRDGESERLKALIAGQSITPTSEVDAESVVG